MSRGSITEPIAPAELAPADAARPSMSWLSADLILLVAPAIDDEAPPLTVLVDREPVEFPARSVVVDGDAGDGEPKAVVALGMPVAIGDRTLEIESDDPRLGIRIGPAPAPLLGVGLRDLIRESLAALDRGARERVLELVLEAVAELGTRDRVSVADSLHTLRDALREPSPRVRIGRDTPQGLHVESLIKVDESSYFVSGWMRDEQAEIVRLTAVSPEGVRIALCDRIFRVHRPDLAEFYETSAGKEEKLGFLCFFELGLPSTLPAGWVFEIENALGIVTEAGGPEVSREPIKARDAIVPELARERGPATGLMEHVVPAVSRLQQRLADAVEIETVECFGGAVADPEVSVVIPLYRRVDLLQHQLARFADDPEMRRAELIYVLDSPELADGLIAEAAELFELYRVPFRLVELSRNGGFAVANNRGASLATGERLLLMNSDVLPPSAGWLGRLLEVHAGIPDVGALGPKLLFEDGSLQHAGLIFERRSPSAAWENRHRFKGMHGDLPAANVACAVPAVTGACLLIDRGLYDEFGGLSTLFVQGDYEDSDLCLRLHDAGYQNWYTPEPALYHLEGRSYSLGDRLLHSRYNSWLQTRLWGEKIERIMGAVDD
jgi:GT2 family glycosyltransferase